MARSNSKVIVFGASAAGRSAYERLKGTCSVAAFYDNDPAKQGSSLFGLPVLSPRVPLVGNAEKVVIAGKYAKEIYVQLTEELGLDPHLVECESVDGATYVWLLENKRLRMDANLAIWQRERRDFHIDRYKFAAGLVKGLKTLDVACGTGYGTHLLAKTATTVVGVDVDEGAVAYAKSRYGGERVAFQRSFGEMLPFKDNSFDAIVCFETIEHVLCPDSLLREFVRLLSMDGTLILSAPNRWGYTPHHFTDFDFELLKSKVDPLFESATYYHNNSGTRKGCGDRGIGLLDPMAADEAECILVVASQPRKKARSRARHMESMLSEIYEVVYQRHQQFINNVIS